MIPELLLVKRSPDDPEIIDGELLNIELMALMRFLGASSLGIELVLSILMTDALFWNLSTEIRYKLNACIFQLLNLKHTARISSYAKSRLENDVNT